MPDQADALKDDLKGLLMRHGVILRMIDVYDGGEEPVGTDCALEGHGIWIVLSKLAKEWADEAAKIGLVMAALLLTACGGSEPTGPSPVPTPTPAPIAQPDPVRFDAAFNAQLVHDAFDHPGSNTRALLLPSSPSIYLQSDGLSPSTVAAMEAEARAVVPMLTGGRLSVAAFESGPGVRTQMVGWIVVEQVNEPDSPVCGRANIGTRAGHVWLNMAHPDTCIRPLQHVLGHELGHALGFYHVADTTCLMSNLRPLASDGLPCDKEQYHASLAYQSNGAYGAEQRVIVVD